MLRHTCNERTTRGPEAPLPRGLVAPSHPSVGQRSRPRPTTVWSAGCRRETRGAPRAATVELLGGRQVNAEALGERGAPRRRRPRAASRSAPRRPSSISVRPLKVTRPRAVIRVQTMFFVKCESGEVCWCSHIPANASSGCGASEKACRARLHRRAAATRRASRRPPRRRGRGGPRPRRRPARRSPGARGTIGRSRRRRASARPPRRAGRGDRTRGRTRRPRGPRGGGGETAKPRCEQIGEAVELVAEPAAPLADELGEEGGGIEADGPPQVDVEVLEGYRAEVGAVERAGVSIVARAVRCGDAGEVGDGGVLVHGADIYAMCTAHRGGASCLRFALAKEAHESQLPLGCTK